MPYFGIPIRNGVPIGLGSVAGFGIAPEFSPSELFAGGVQGAWFDPSDATTLFSDRAGTTPCAAPGAGALVPVGLMLDKSQNGVGTNGAYRYNLLTQTEAFNDSAWAKISATTTANAAVAPDGTTTADTLAPDNGISVNISAVGLFTAGAVSYVRNASTISLQNTPYTASFYVKANTTLTHIQFRVGTTDTLTGTSYTVIVRLSDGFVVTADGTTTSQSVGNGWYRVTLTFTPTANSYYSGFWFWNDASITCNGTQNVFAWGAQLALATAPSAYQRITDTWYATMAGNHAIAANDTTARPELSARVNLLTYSEQFDNGVWQGYDASISANATTGPFGSNTADKLIESATTAIHFLGGSLVGPPVISFVSGVAYTYSIYCKKAERNYAQLYLPNAPFPDAGRNAVFNLDSGTIVTAQTGVTASISGPFNGFYRCVITATADATTTIGIPGVALSTDGTLNQSYTGDGTSGIFIWGADLRPTNIGTTIPAYQRVADQYTYDTVGFPRYLAANGTSSAMSTPANVNLSGTDKVTVFAGVRKLSDAARGIAVELGNGNAANNGVFLVETPSGFLGDFAFASRGNNGGFNSGAYGSVAAPATRVMSGIGNISGDISTLRLNGVVAQTNTADQGTGNYSSYPLFIGSRNTSSLFLNGNIYSLTVVGSALTAGQIGSMEQYVAGKTGITVP